MLLHKKCKSSVNLDITGQLALHVNFGLAKNNIKVGSGEIFIKDNKFAPVFYCPKCKSTVENDDLSSFCMDCGKELEVSVAFKPSRSSGIYCQECIKYFEGESITNLSKIIREVVI